MTIATGARSKVGYIVETVFGTTPTLPNLTEIPFTQHSVNMTREEYDDNSIRSDRMERYSLSGNKSVAGAIDVNFAHSIYDVLLESLLQSTFTTNVLKTGTTRKSFTLETQHLDIAQYVVHTGLIVDKMEMTIPASGIVTAKFDVIAKDQSALAVATIDTDSTYTTAAAKSPFTDNGTSGFCKEGGAAVGYITNIQFTVDNGHAKNFTVGTNVIRDFTTNNAKITGTVTVFFEDAVMYNKFVNGTASSIDVKLDDGTNTVEIAFPNVKYTGATKTISGNGPVTVAMPFKALYDATALSNIVITRT
jgi:hypothetical protein